MDTAQQENPSVTHDLGNDWYLNQRADGSLTIRNCERGQRFDLTAEEAARLREIIKAGA